MKKILFLFVSFIVFLNGDDIVVFKNEYKVLPLKGKLKKVVIGNKDIINVSLLDNSLKRSTLLKIYGKQSGNTSILMVFRDGSLKNYHVFVNQNLGFIQKMINKIAPSIYLSRVGDGSIVLSGVFDDPHQKKRVYTLLEKGGVDLNSLMDITKTKKVNKMIRTKLYLVQIDNNKAKDLGGVVGLGLVNENVNLSINPDATTGVTFSGWLLNNSQSFSSEKGFSLSGTLKFLQTKGVAKILDDTVLITTEDKNASFHVGGDVYIPIGITQTNAGYPTIQLEEKEYGLRLTLTTEFMDKDDFMHLKVQIEDSEFDPNKDHYVKLGGDSGAFSDGIEVPSFLSKHITTDIVAKSKQVIALGGRLHKSETEVKNKIPILGDIPLLGWLFSSKEKKYQSNDLLFFLVPEIVDANDVVDDSNFYKDLYKESKEFHKNFVLQDKSLDSNKSILKNDTNTTISPDDSNDNGSVVIEIEDNNDTLNDSINSKENTDKNLGNKSDVDNISFENNQTSKSDNKLDNESKTFIINDKDVNTTEEVLKDQGLDKVESKENFYEVNIDKIFIRDEPLLNGKRVDVWKKSHKFVAIDEIKKGGIVWLKIIKNCNDEDCYELTSPLWISKKYVKKVTNISNYEN